MSALYVNVFGTRVAAADSEERVTVSAILGGIDECLRRWKAVRHEGQGVLTGLSNAILLRTHIDSGRTSSSDGDGGKIGGTIGGNIGGNLGGSSAVWGVLANAGTALSRVSIATEARVRRLHSELSALQDAMLAAAAGIRRHALEARRRCQTIPTAGHPARGDNVAPDTAAAVAAVGVKVKSVGDNGADDPIAIGGGYGLVDVADAASEVADMLLKEALVTATVAQGVAKCQDDREALTAYAAAWMMQPYVDARRVKELEAMVGGSGGGRARP